MVAARKVTPIRASEFAPLRSHTAVTAVMSGASRTSSTDRSQLWHHSSRSGSSPGHTSSTTVWSAVSGLATSAKG